jgi:hypothetical protein
MNTFSVAIRDPLRSPVSDAAKVPAKCDLRPPDVIQAYACILLIDSICWCCKFHSKAASAVGVAYRYATYRVGGRARSIKLRLRLLGSLQVLPT